jgi:glutathione S-transferase
LVNDRLDGRQWWYDNSWSVMDAYLFWVYWRCEGADYVVAPIKNFTDHARRMEQRPAVQRALAREKAAEAQLESEGLNFKPPPRSSVQN